jgi:hypothetical protein
MFLDNVNMTYAAGNPTGILYSDGSLNAAPGGSGTRDFEGNSLSLFPIGPNYIGLKIVMGSAFKIDARVFGNVVIDGTDDVDTNRWTFDLKSIISCGDLTIDRCVLTNIFGSCTNLILGKNANGSFDGGYATVSDRSEGKFTYPRKTKDFGRHGEVLLSYDSGTGNIQVKPVSGGTFVFNNGVDDVVDKVPLIGAQLPATGLAPSTMHYIYFKRIAGSVIEVSRAANVATVKMSAAHGLNVGAGVWLENISVAGFNSSIDLVGHRVTAVTADTISFANIGANVAATTVDGSFRGYMLIASTTARGLTYQGIPYKSDDGAARFVGWAVPDTGPIWRDTASKRWVRSYFNDHGLQLHNGITATRTLATNANFQELEVASRVSFIATGPNDIITMTANGGVFSDTLNAVTYTAIGFDPAGGIAPEDGRVWFTQEIASKINAVSVRFTKTGLTEGLHEATILGRTSAGNASWQYLSGVERMTIDGSVSPVRN